MTTDIHDTFAPMTPAELAAHDAACYAMCDAVERQWLRELKEQEEQGAK